MSKKKKSILIENANIRGKKDLVDIAIEDGKISDIGNDLALSKGKKIDAEGRLVTPTFVDPHIHLDNALKGREAPEEHTVTLEGGVKLTQKWRRERSAEEVKERAIEHIKTMVKYGVTKARAITDVSTIGGLKGLEGVLAAKKECNDIIDLQIQAFPEDGVFTQPGTEDLLYEAMEKGADVIGGKPRGDLSIERGEKQVDLLFDIAKKHNADIDIHLDQARDPLSEFLEYTCVKTLQKGYEGRVTGAHCTSLAYQTRDHAMQVISLVKEAEINICANASPVVQMGIESEPRTRGITRVRQLVKEGVNVTTGSDTVCDGFHLYGTGDPLDYGLLLAYLAQYNTVKGARNIFDMITHNSAKSLRLKSYGIEIGNPADLNIIDVPNVSEALRLRPDRSYVIKEGDIVAKDGKLLQK